MQSAPNPVSILFHSFTLPTGVAGRPCASSNATATRYESSVLVTGGLSGRFRGSVYPDNMDVKGRLLNGSYQIFLGFHTQGVPTQDKLNVKINGFRPVLVINRGQPVPVLSNSPIKNHSAGIHIHNGYHHWSTGTPMSEGCLLLHPSDWSRFLGLFLDAFPSLSDWSTKGSRIGRKIGTVTVQAFTPMGDFRMPRGGSALA
jgi:hypothetical protein